MSDGGGPSAWEAHSGTPGRLQAFLGLLGTPRMAWGRRRLFSPPRGPLGCRSIRPHGQNGVLIRQSTATTADYVEKVRSQFLSLRHHDASPIFSA
jgi:hypothetical protein